MGNFIQENSFVRVFQTNSDFSVRCLGYDDFTFVKAFPVFRVQNFYTWHFVISGRGRLEIGGKSYDLAEGDSFFVPPATPMRYFPDASDPWEYVWFSFNGDISAAYGEQLGFSPDAPARRCRHFGSVKQILSRTIEELRSEKHGYYKVLSSFYELMDLATFVSHPRTPVSAVLDLIDQHYTLADYTVEKLCNDAGYSHVHLLRLFKREYGKTIRDYIIEKRLSLSCELLESSDLSVRSVALSCGFSDDIHFMKCFKKRFSLTPSEYRQRAK